MGKGDIETSGIPATTETPTVPGDPGLYVHYDQPISIEHTIITALTEGSQNEQEEHNEG
jgi:hypothetical protein